MPKQRQSSKEEIIEVAFDLVRKNGIHDLSARNIAKKMQCSTKPIYSSFSSMYELEQIVIEKASAFVTENYLDTEPGDHMHFLQIGIGYLNLARQDRELFYLLFLSGKVDMDIEKNIYPFMFDSLIQKMKKDELLAPLTEEQLKKLLRNMWIYTHGLATFLYTNPTLMTDDFVHQAIHDMGYIVISWELSKSNEV